MKVFFALAACCAVSGLACPGLHADQPESRHDLPSSSEGTERIEIPDIPPVSKTLVPEKIVSVTVFKNPEDVKKYTDNPDRGVIVIKTKGK